MFSSRMIVFTRQLEEFEGVGFGDGGEVFEEHVEGVAAVEVIEEGLRRDAGASEDEGAAKNFAVGLDRAVVEREHGAGCH